MVPALSIVSGGTTRTIFSNRPMVIDQPGSLVFKYQSGVAQIWIDGLKVAEALDAPTSIAASTAGVQIGGDNSTSGTVAIPGGTFVNYTLDGRLSDIAVWNTALTDAQILDELFLKSVREITAVARFTNVPALTEVRLFDGATEIGGLEITQATQNVEIDYSVGFELTAQLGIVNVYDFKPITQQVVLPRLGRTFPVDLLLKLDRNYLEHGWQQEFAPENTTAPTISGSPNVGQLLTCSPGDWFGTTPINYGYQWRRDGVAIAGAISSTYTPDYLFCHRIEQRRYCWRTFQWYWFVRIGIGRLLPAHHRGDDSASGGSVEL